MLSRNFGEYFGSVCVYACCNKNKGVDMWETKRQQQSFDLYCFILCCELNY